MVSANKVSISNERGFTVVEVLVIVVLIGLLFTPVIGGLFFFYGNTVASTRQTQLALDSQNLVRSISESLRTAAAVRTSNAISDPNGGGGWTTSDVNNVLVVATPALNASNQFITNAGTPYQNELVYFVSNGALYRRSLANTSASGNSMTRTCPAASVSPTCPADAVFSTKVKNIGLTFYDQAGVVTTTLANARSVQLLVQMEDKLFGKTLTFDNTIRITLRNSL